MSKPPIVLAILAVAAVLAFDAVAAFASKTGGAGHRWFGILEIVLYLGIGFVSGRMLGSWRSALGVVAIAALAEATLGWYVSAAIGPGRLLAPSLGLLIVAASFSVVWNGCIGLIGAVVGCRYTQTRPAL